MRELVEIGDRVNLAAWARQGGAGVRGERGGEGKVTGGDLAGAGVLFEDSGGGDGVGVGEVLLIRLHLAENIIIGFSAILL